MIIPLKNRSIFVHWCPMTDPCPWLNTLHILRFQTAPTLYRTVDENGDTPRKGLNFFKNFRINPGLPFREVIQSQLYNLLIIHEKFAEGGFADPRQSDANFRECFRVSTISDIRYHRQVKRIFSFILLILLKTQSLNMWNLMTSSFICQTIFSQKSEYKKYGQKCKQKYLCDNRFL